MTYVLKQYDVIKGEKVENFLVDVVKLSEPLAHKVLQKGRVVDHKKGIVCKQN
ncbi:MAG: hypothetical protein GQ531_05950 [Sulfurovum sp.]|nr:hypothetical protein [Sulfurovum sp.]